jgi:hypothetical protein
VLEIAAGEFRLGARLEEEAAPRTVAAFRRLLPLDSRIIHARWSGEACWIPFGELDVGLGSENATCYPAPGQLLFYPGGVSETEILFPYGSTSFASKAGRWPATTSPRSSRAPSSCPSSAAEPSGRAHRRSASRRSNRHPTP